MEGFSNWDREEPFEPFTVMLFKGLQVVAFMFFLAYLAINTDAKQGKVDTKAEMLVTVSWPDTTPTTSTLMSRIRRATSSGTM